MRHIYVFLVLFFLCLPVIFPPRVAAEITPTEQQRADTVCVEKGICIPTDVGGFVSTYYGYGLSMIGGLSLLFIIYGGYMVMTSKGNPIQLNNGKSYIGYAIIGLLMAIFGYTFTELITRDIIKIPGFN